MPPHRPPSSSLKLIEWKKEKEKKKKTKEVKKRKISILVLKKCKSTFYQFYVHVVETSNDVYLPALFFQMNFSDNCIYSFIAAKNHPFRKPAIFPFASLPPPSICTRFVFKINSPEFSRAATTSRHWTVVIGKSVSSYFRSLNKSSSE